MQSVQLGRLGEMICNDKEVAIALHRSWIWTNHVARPDLARNAAIDFMKPGDLPLFGFTYWQTGHVGAYFITFVFMQGHMTTPDSFSYVFCLLLLPVRVVSR